MRTPEQMIGRAAEIAAHLFALRGDLLPFWIGERSDGSEFFFDSNFLRACPVDVLESPEGKSFLMALVRAILRREGVQVYGQAMEAWMIRVAHKPGDPPPREWNTREGIRNHPDRFEVIAYQSGDRRGNVFGGTQSIIRPAGGVPRLDDDLTIQSDYGFKGRMIDLLGRPRTRDGRDELRRALALLDAIGPIERGVPVPPKPAEPDSVVVVAPNGTARREGRR